MSTNWTLHGIDIGIPLNIDYSVSSDISTDRVNGSKTVGYAKSVNATEFKVTFFKEFADDSEEVTFRKQLEQLQYGIEFMPYELRTYGLPQELDSHLVLVKDINMNREEAKVGWMKYDITFVDQGHKTEFINYIMYRADPVPTPWPSIEANRMVTIYYPVGAVFHSDAPNGYENTSVGPAEYRNNPSTYIMYHQGGVGVERIGIRAYQDGVQLFSPHAQIGAGFTVENGQVKLEWDETGNVTFYRWSNGQWDNYHQQPPTFKFYFYTFDSNQQEILLGEFDTRSAVSKLQLKRFTPEYIEIEQEFQWSNGVIGAIMFHMCRGRNDVQMRGRGINAYIDYWEPYVYIKYNYVWGQKAYYNGTFTVLSSSTNINQVLTVPSFYVDLADSVGAGYIGFVNPDRYKTVTATIQADQNNGYFLMKTRHSWNMAPKVWSPPIMYYMGAVNPSNKENQAGFLIDAGSQMLHRTRVY